MDGDGARGEDLRGGAAAATTADVVRVGGTGISHGRARVVE